MNPTDCSFKLLIYLLTSSFLFFFMNERRKNVGRTKLTFSTFKAPLPGALPVEAVRCQTYPHQMPYEELFTDRRQTSCFRTHRADGRLFVTLVLLVESEWVSQIDLSDWLMGSEWPEQGKRNRKWWSWSSLLNFQIHKYFPNDVKNLKSNISWSS